MLPKFKDDKEEKGYHHMIKLYDIEPEKCKFLETRIKPILLELIKKCLTVNCSHRTDFRALLDFFEADTDSLTIQSQSRKKSTSLGNTEYEEHTIESVRLKLFNGKSVRSSYLATCKKKLKEEDEDIEGDHLWRRGVDEVFYLWKLAGGDFLQTIKQNGRLTNRLMPVEKMPLFITVDEGRELGKPCDEETLFDETIVPLSLVNLRNRLNLLRPDVFYPLIEKPESSNPANHKTENLLDLNFNNETNIARKVSYSFI